MCNANSRVRTGEEATHSHSSPYRYIRESVNPLPSTSATHICTRVLTTTLLFITTPCKPHISQIIHLPALSRTAAQTGRPNSTKQDSQFFINALISRQTQCNPHKPPQICRRSSNSCRAQSPNASLISFGRKQSHQVTPRDCLRTNSWADAAKKLDESGGEFR